MAEGFSLNKLMVLKGDRGRKNLLDKSSLDLCFIEIIKLGALAQINAKYLTVWLTYIVCKKYFCSALLAKTLLAVFCKMHASCSDLAESVEHKTGPETGYESVKTADLQFFYVLRLATMKFTLLGELE